MTFSIEQAQIRLAEIISQGKPDESIFIEQDGRPVAQLVVMNQQRRPASGLLKGKIRIIEDDDSHLADFKEYME